ncbi:MAG: hypothetical protein NC123_04365 [Butyrivibrio sp.]|nr:hypothetical protein [Acetatifactor muris]MCM1558762.1 hypothetical protein [Butyrivibrio sp.]
MSKEKTLLGYRRFTSKSNKPCCVAVVGTVCDSNDNSRGSFGMSAEDVFLPSEMYSYLEPGDIGKPVTLNYNVSNGRAYINDFYVERTKTAVAK